MKVHIFRKREKVPMSQGSSWCSCNYRFWSLWKRSYDYLVRIEIDTGRRRRHWWRGRFFFRHHISKCDKTSPFFWWNFCSNNNNITKNASQLPMCRILNMCNCRVPDASTIWLGARPCKIIFTASLCGLFDTEVSLTNGWGLVNMKWQEW